MITIKKSPTADSRTATAPVSKQQLLESSKQHIVDVAKAMDWFSMKLSMAARNHDHTKVSGINSFFDSFERDQQNRKEGNPLTFMQEEWFLNHVRTERHHLRDFCPDDVNLLDVLERVADITMAGMARSGSIYADTLDPVILTRAYQNTIKLLKENITVED